MTEYKLHISAKTSLLNKIRRVFMLPVMEKALLQLQKSFPGKLTGKLIPPHYLYQKNSMRQTFHRGSQLELDISEMVDHYLYWGLDSNEYVTAENTIRNAKVILDIGANIGSTVLYFASLNTTARIFAFEPNEVTFNKLLRNVALNKYSNIYTLKSGLGDRRDEVRLYEVDDTNPGMNRILSHEEKLPFTLIHIDTLDNFCRENKIQEINFMKIDVEGYEYHVLKGGSDIIPRSNPEIFMELDDNNLKANQTSAYDLIQLLAEFGYTCIFRTDTNETINSNTDFKNCHYDIIARKK